MDPFMYSLITLPFHFRIPLFSPSDYIKRHKTTTTITNMAKIYK